MKTYPNQKVLVVNKPKSEGFFNQNENVDSGINPVKEAPVSPPTAYVSS